MNQDRWGQGESRLFVVADGIGGNPGGHIASESAVGHLLRIDPVDGWMPALSKANDAVRSDCVNAGFPRAGTTIVALLVEDERSILISSGDSRIYRLRQRELELLTEDHSILVRHRVSGVTTTALTAHFGIEASGFVTDLATADNEPADRYLLCTDGVYGPLAHEKLALTLSADDAGSAAQRVVELAHASGGRDDATALVVDLGGFR